MPFCEQVYVAGSLIDHECEQMSSPTAFSSSLGGQRISSMTYLLGNLGLHLAAAELDVHLSTHILSLAQMAHTI